MDGNTLVLIGDSKVYFFDKDAQTWTQGSGSDSPRTNAMCAKFNAPDGAKIALIGGNVGGEVSKFVEILDVESKTWTNAGNIKKFPIILVV